VVVIRGDGVAARCCAHLLARSGVPVSYERTDRPRLPVILLSEAAQALLRDVFGRADLFRDRPGIVRRVVAWGREARPIELDHSAVVLSEEELLAALGDVPLADGSGTADWRVLAARPLPISASDRHFGSRMASTTCVELQTSAAANCCWIESVEGGWLFLIAAVTGSGWLVSVGGANLRQSRLIRELVATCQTSARQFPSSPRMTDPLGEPGWIACGSAAMAFDPICGDGTAHAVREAILAAAVIGAALRGEDPAPLLAHYQSRLIAGFQRHLGECLHYYTTGGDGAWWTAEAESVKDGLHWCAGRLTRHGPFRYRLDGFDLRPIE
jgi:hypothetical protein